MIIIKTFRLRLTLFYTFAVVLIIMAAAFVIHYVYGKELMEKIDDELLSSAKQMIVNEIGPKTLRRNEEIIIKAGKEYYQIMNYQGEVIITSLSKNQQWALNTGLMLDAFEGSSRFETVKFMGGDFRTLYFPVNRETILRIGASMEDISEGLAGLRRLFLIFLPFIIAISALMSWFFAGLALDPVLKIKTLAEQIRSGRLRGRINIGLKGREIDDLAIIFNDMLDRIQRSVETQQRFVSDVSHEIRSPLTSLRGNIEVTLRRKRTLEEYEDLLRANLSDIIRLSRITDHLLFLTKADNNIIELRMQWFDINYLLSTMIDQMRYGAESKGVSVVKDFGESLEIHGDMYLLEQAFSNLLENAVKYTPEGGKVTVKTEEGDGRIEVTVSDTGIGIPKEDIPHIFERFYRVDKERSRKAGGTGLGLSITDWIIRAHGGKITVRSTPGQGSDFIATFYKTAE